MYSLGPARWCGVNNKIINQSVVGFIAMHKKDWGTASTISIGDKKLRLEIGKNSGKRIELYYNIDIWAENLFNKLYRIFDKLKLWIN